MNTKRLALLQGGHSLLLQSIFITLNKQSNISNSRQILKQCLTMSSTTSIATHLQRTLDSSSAVARLISSHEFWPAIIKGGIENTLRDCMLFDLNMASNGDPVYTRERSRLDIVSYARADLDEKQSNKAFNAKPQSAVELKFNFITQNSQLDRASSKLAKMIDQYSHAFPIAAVHFLCEIWNADPASASLLVRYGAHRTLNKPESELESHLSQLNRDPGSGDSFVPKVERFPIRSNSNGAPQGCIAAVVWWPSKEAGAFNPALH